MVAPGGRVICKTPSFRRKPESRGAGAGRRSSQAQPDLRLTPFNSPWITTASQTSTKPYINVINYVDFRIVVIP